MDDRMVPRPTGAELEILRVLWRSGPLTVRQVQEALRRDPPIGYTTTLKTLQVMAEKGLVDRDESRRSHVYRARVDESQSQRRLVGDLMDRAFGGSAQRLVMQALEARPASAEELAEIRRLLDRLEGGRS
jgi:predicted transcriptional regulator